MTADLHIHTTFSDGTFTPQEIVKLAKEADLKTIAITDHDVVDGIDPALQAGREIGVEVIPGIEFSCELVENEIHILGYFIDWKQEWFIELLKKMQDSRKNRIHKMLEKLKSLKIDLDADKIFKISGDGSVGRPHVARLLVEEGYVRNTKEAFDKYLSFDGPAYVSHYKLSPQEAINLIKDLKGISVLSHPWLCRWDELIPEFAAGGLDGIEVFYPGQESQIDSYLKLAEKYNLVVTGGSDFHGNALMRDVSLGRIALDDSWVDKLKEAGQIKHAG